MRNRFTSDTRLSLRCRRNLTSSFESQFYYCPESEIMSRSHQRVTYVQLDTLRISSIPYELSGRRVHADDWLRNEFSHSLSAFDSDAVRFCLLSTDVALLSYMSNRLTVSHIHTTASVDNNAHHRRTPPATDVTRSSQYLCRAIAPQATIHYSTETSLRVLSRPWPCNTGP